MPLPLFLTLAAINEAVFGLGFLLVPDLALAGMGVTLAQSAAMLVRIFGAALFSLALMYWWVRNSGPSDARTAIFRASAFYYAVSAVPLIAGVLMGLANALAWGSVGIHILLAYGFWHFGFRKAN